jgi:hypothetical protein
MSDDERMTRAESAYTAGDFASVRRLTAELIGSSDPDVARRARELLARVAVDPGSGIVLGLALALFACIVVAYAR